MFVILVTRSEFFLSVVNETKQNKTNLSSMLWYLRVINDTLIVL